MEYCSGNQDNIMTFLVNNKFIFPNIIKLFTLQNIFVSFINIPILNRKKGFCVTLQKDVGKHIL